MKVSIYFENGEKIQLECEKASTKYSCNGDLIEIELEKVENKKFLYLKLSKVIAVIRED